MVTILRCQKCHSGYEYSGPLIKANVRIACEQCGKTTLASPFVLINPGDAQFRPLPPEQKPAKPGARLQAQFPHKSQDAQFNYEGQGVRDYQPIPQLSADEEAVFWHYVNKGEADVCWLWNGTRNSGGYGRFYLYAKSYVASRVAWRIGHGTDPGQAQVAQTCGNRACCNPSHLTMRSRVGQS